MASFLLDSDVLIWILRGRRDTLDLVENLLGQSANPLACSVLSLLEIRVGMKSQEESKTTMLLNSLTTIPIESKTAIRAADLIRKRKLDKNPKAWIDALIAATCLLGNFKLVTYNIRDYPYSDVDKIAIKN